MKRINIKKVLTVLLLMIFIVSFSTVVFGDGSALEIDKIKPINTVGVTNVREVAGTILAIAQAIGVSVAVIMLVVLAIKYFLSSAQDKAEIKKSASAYVIGAILLFGGVAILNLIQNFAVKM